MLPRVCTIDAGRLAQRLDELATFGKDPGGGWSRFSLSAPYTQARELIKGWMEQAGMTVRVDAAGNMIGRLEADGNSTARPVIATGSHVDTARQGGKFDGNLGVLAGLEAIDAIAQSGLPRPHPMELIIFLEEEGSRFGASLFGSAAMAGRITPERLNELVDPDGISLWKALEQAGLNPLRVAEARPPDGYYKCFLELHIEQAAVLEASAKTLGVVRGIAAPWWFRASITGCPNHAGATPMPLRKDALAAAAEVICAVESIVKAAGEHTVGTVGYVQVTPNAKTIIPGRVDMCVDVRDIYQESRDQAVARVKERLEQVCARRGLPYEMEDLMKAAPVLIPDYLTALIEESAEAAGVPWMQLVSGAAHDAQFMADITDVAMIFTPSKDGRSHCPEEFTAMEDIIPCANVLLDVLAKLQGS